MVSILVLRALIPAHLMLSLSLTTNKRYAVSHTYDKTLSTDHDVFQQMGKPTSDEIKKMEVGNCLRLKYGAY